MNPSSSLLVGLDGRRRGVMELRNIIFHRSSPQTATEGRMAKVLPKRVRRSEAAVGRAGVDEGEGLNADEGRPRALLTAGCGTSDGCSFVGRPRFGGCAGSASSGVYAGLSLEILTTS